MRIALIPARGGSKRIPRKNIKNFLGKPVIAYSIDAAYKSGCFDQIIVSTDDEEIARIAKDYGADVPFVRPKNLSNDHATTLSVIKHALLFFKKERSIKVDLACCIYPCAPMIQSNDIRIAYEVLLESRLSYSFPVCKFPYPVQRALFVDSDGVRMLAPEHSQTRSQDLPQAYHDVGQFCWGRARAFENDVPVFSSASKPIIIPRYRAVDIDSPEDWEIAMKLYEATCRN